MERDVRWSKILDEWRKLIIPSPDTRRWFDENDYTFTYDEIFRLIIQQEQVGLPERIRTLDEISAAVNDPEFTAKLDAYKKAKSEAWEMFKSNDEGKYVFVLTYDFAGDEADGDPSTVISLDAQSLVREAVRDSSVAGKWFIEKRSLFNPSDGELPSFDQVGHLFAIDGNVINVNVYDRDATDVEDSFEEWVAMIPMPFEFGDVVFDMDDGKFGIVEQPHSEWDNMMGQYRNLKEDENPNHLDNTVSVVFFYPEENRFYHRHINPIYLRYVTREDYEDLSDARMIRFLHTVKHLQGATTSLEELSDCIQFKFPEH